MAHPPQDFSRRGFCCAKNPNVNTRSLVNAHDFALFYSLPIWSPSILKPEPAGNPAFFEPPEAAGAFSEVSPPCLKAPKQAASEAAMTRVVIAGRVCSNYRIPDKPIASVFYSLYNHVVPIPNIAPHTLQGFHLRAPPKARVLLCKILAGQGMESRSSIRIINKGIVNTQPLYRGLYNCHMTITKGLGSRKPSFL